ncbi:Phosphoribulokinase / Uridine kinase family isoform 2 [Hibiscus syriacus]|uniref:Phosphoribulokinase / Uridine kinase family isoform 2 n=1 Tax=Hibiscus syriacus TaxID=106335 RepID=A0A6A3BS15_HIBSY|nr:Phosphoribulokinase / Uridine kinase family isoform 2 [Hibiscus syriacus]
MPQDASSIEAQHKRAGLLKDQVRLVKRKDCDHYEIVSIQEPLSFEKGFFVVIRACQLLAQKNDGIILVGLAGPSGAGKTVFTEKILNFMPSIATISMDNYNEASRIVDGNFDDVEDFNQEQAKEGKEARFPSDFKASSRVGYRTLEVPSSRIVIIEGIYALSEAATYAGSSSICHSRVPLDMTSYFSLVINSFTGPINHAITAAKLKICIGNWRCNCRYVEKVCARKRPVSVKCFAEQLGLEGSYIPRTYIEQIQLEKLVNEVMALPEDLKTKLSLDEDLVSSPKEELLRASTNRVFLRNRHLKSGMSHSYSTQREKNMSNFAGYNVSNRNFVKCFDNLFLLYHLIHYVGSHHQLSEQISLNDRMDELTIEELNSKLAINNSTSSQQNLAFQAETMQWLCANFSLHQRYPALPGTTTDQHQLDNLSNLLHERIGERSQQAKTRKKNTAAVYRISLSSSNFNDIGNWWSGNHLYRGILTRG